ncbi:MAG TPA: 2'-5' RNA ligase family protein [Phenylobacterium sp.]|nr:2'-5' RNA ligase family protein [Phenylobacterium sp.]
MRPGEYVLYFALQPPVEAQREVRRRLAEAKARWPLTARPVPPERLHVSLCGVGAFPSLPHEVVTAARCAGAAARDRPFRVAFNRLGAWGRGEGPRPLVLWGDEGVIGVESLHQRLHAALAALGLAGGAPGPIWPHMTLLRDRTAVPETVVPKVDWWVREFVLIASLHGAGRHEVLGRFPLVA